MTDEEWEAHLALAKAFAHHLPREAWEEMRGLPPEEREQQMIRWFIAFAEGDGGEERP